ncbi:acyltransferase [Flavobacterium sp. KACC 22761]|uniref:acyltransferase n=1 Tax=Flavobacterium sp. KACC 22761 TaxID=3092665 RepID=UPI002A76348E|nr:acyltransferase [Flavobacterium sp. KACC 22761]WPO79092.1 acyltransferase [Flavobacterium sp. KACC 22761]
MQLFFIGLLKILRRARLKILRPFDQIRTYLILYSNGVKFQNFKSHGLPKVVVSLGGKCSIGANFKINNHELSNPIGRFHPCSIFVGKKAELIIGKNVGMSSTAIVCHEKIEIGDNVNLGGNVVIYDTDFHSLNSQDRLDPMTDVIKTKTKAVKICNNVFIGAHSTILKGVVIGDNSIIGACSVVTKNIPENEIWAGNPANFIRKLS